MTDRFQKSMAAVQCFCVGSHTCWWQDCRGESGTHVMEKIRGGFPEKWAFNELLRTVRRQHEERRNQFLLHNRRYAKKRSMFNHPYELQIRFPTVCCPTCTTCSPTELFEAFRVCISIAYLWAHLHFSAHICNMCVYILNHLIIVRDIVRLFCVHACWLLLYTSI